MSTLRAKLVSLITGRIRKLSREKLSALFSNAGVSPSDQFYECLCKGHGGDYHYFIGEGGEGSCCRIGPLGGITIANFEPGLFAGCSAAHPLSDGCTLIDAITDRVEEIRGTRGR